jgi:hypothetical protein
MLWLLAVLNSPVESIEKIDPKFIIENRECLVYCIKKLEITDDWENINLLTSEDIANHQLGILQGTYQILKNTPFVKDFHPRYKIAPAETFSHSLQMIRQHKYYLQERLEWELDREDVLREAIRQTERCYLIWDAIVDINSGDHRKCYKRLAYSNLITLLGDELGAEILPDMIPQWTARKR